MNVLTEEKVAIRLQSKDWNSAKISCRKYAEAYGTNSNLLLSVFAIETFYRPRWQRIIEYFVVLIGCIRCLLFKTPIRNYTIGKCQLGLSTILNFYGGSCYQHAQNISISSIVEMRQLFSAISTDKSIEILAFRLKPIALNAERIYPNKRNSCIRYIGEQFNGRFSYGMLLTEVYKQLENAA